MCNYTDRPIRLLGALMDTVRNYDMLDFATFKICILSVGLLLGGAFSRSFRRWAPVVALIAVASYAYLIYKTLREVALSEM